MAIHLIRHGSAGKRTAHPDDSTRPLDAKGHAQAAAIAEALSGDGINRILSSPALRCQQTVGALALRCSVDLEVVDWLAEGNSELTVIKKLAKLSSQNNSGNVALCSHGDIIPEVIRSLEAQGMRVKGERGWKKGAVWTIRMRDGAAESAYYSPMT